MKQHDVLVDSSAWIEALRRDGDIKVKLAVEGLLDAYAAVWCSPVRLEVMGGAREQERHRIGAYFSVIPFLSTSNQDWEDAIAVAWRLRDSGLTLPWIDMLVATIAIRSDLRLYTTDAHFSRIAAIAPLRLYQPAYGGTFKPLD